MVYSLQELADAVGGKVHGQADYRIEGVGTIRNASASQVTFLANRSYAKYLPETRAGAVIIGEHDLINCPVAAIIVSNPYLAYAKIAVMLNPAPPAVGGIHPDASVDAQAQVHPAATVTAQAIGGRTGDTLGACQQVALLAWLIGAATL